MNNLWNKLLRLFKVHNEIESPSNSICPLPVELNLDSVKRVLVIAPHPDDEVLGCGGTIALLAQSADIKVLLVTDGSGAGGLPAGTGEIRKQEMRDALNVLGVNDLIYLDEPDGFFKNSKQFSAHITHCISNFDPEWVFIPSIEDFHRDHYRIGSAIIELARHFKHSIRLFQFEVWNPVSATHVVDISSVMSLKLEALQCHQSILACAPYARAITGLAKYRSLYLSRNAPNEAFAECYQEYIRK